MEENNFIQTDEKTMIKIDWIKDIKIVDKCFVIETTLDGDNFYHVCEPNPAHKIIDRLYTEDTQNQK